MRKRMILLISILVFMFGLGYYVSLPRYVVWNSISESNSFHWKRDTSLKVIVCQFWNYFDDDLIEQIYEEHMKVNDYADTSVEINLYYTKWNKKPYKTETFSND